MEQHRQQNTAWSISYCRMRITAKATGSNSKGNSKGNSTPRYVDPALSRRVARAHTEPAEQAPEPQGHEVRHAALEGERAARNRENIEGLSACSVSLYAGCGVCNAGSNQMPAQQMLRASCADSVDIVTISVECRLIRRHKSEESALLLGVRKGLIGKTVYVSYNSLSFISIIGEYTTSEHRSLLTITNLHHDNE